MFEVAPLSGHGSLSSTGPLDPRSLLDVYYQSVRFNIIHNHPPNTFGLQSKITFVKHSVVFGTLVLIASPTPLPCASGRLICGERHMITYAHWTRRYVARPVKVTSFIDVSTPRLSMCGYAPALWGHTCLFSTGTSHLSVWFWPVFVRSLPEN
jgi:hypothetical protein